DQWAFLATVRRNDRDAIDQIVARAEKRGRIVGVQPAPAEETGAQWPARLRQAPLSRPLPDRVEITISNHVYVPKAPVTSGLYNRLLRMAAFENPEFIRAQAMRLPAYAKPRVIACAEDGAHHIGLPRGCLVEVLDLLSRVGIEVVVRDERNAGSPLDATFRG